VCVYFPSIYLEQVNMQGFFLFFILLGIAGLCIQILYSNETENKQKWLLVHFLVVQHQSLLEQKLS